MSIEASWTAEAKALGFKSEMEMLHYLYRDEQFSIAQIAHILGYSSFSVRRRLIQAGVEMRGRGGAAPRLGRRRLVHLSDDTLFHSKVKDICTKEGVSPATVWCERKLRKGEKTDELLRFVSVGISASDEEFEDTYGSSSASDGSEILDILPEPPPRGEGSDIG